MWSFLGRGSVILVAVVGLASAAAATPSADAAYFAWVRQCVGGIAQELPGITASAQVAAGHFVRDNWDLGAWGEGSFADEFTGRAGGLMPIVAPSTTGGAHPVIVLYCPHEAHLADDWAAIRAFHAHGDLVIAFTRPELVAEAARAGLKFDFVVDNHAAPHGGLFPVGLSRRTPEWVVPTDPVANMIGLWTWVGEFVGACTRLGKMPPMWQSFMVPGAHGRDTPFIGMRFHAGTPTPIAPGWVGRQYLSSLRWSLDTLDRLEADHIATAGEEAHAAHVAGHAAYAALTGHSFVELLGCPHDPGYLTKLVKDWSVQREDITVQRGDFVLCVGYDSPFVGTDFGNLEERARATGATVVTSCTDYHPELIAALPPGEMFIDQRWDLGDALVQLPGYDIKVLPPSGVIGQTILWMVEAKYWQLEQ
jgi:hypothetical protein